MLNESPSCTTQEFFRQVSFSVSIDRLGRLRNTTCSLFLQIISVQFCKIFAAKCKICAIRQERYFLCEKGNSNLEITTFKMVHHYTGTSLFHCDENLIFWMTFFPWHILYTIPRNVQYLGVNCWLAAHFVGTEHMCPQSVMTSFPLVFSTSFNGREVLEGCCEIWRLQALPFFTLKVTNTLGKWFLVWKTNLFDLSYHISYPYVL